MSRIGRMPIAIPGGVTVDIAENNLVTVKGPTGTLTRSFPTEMELAVENNELTVKRPNDLKKMKSDHESRVRHALEDKSENENLQYEAIIDYIDLMLEFEYWDKWTSYLLNAQPIATKEKIDDIEEIHKYITSRVWPGRYPERRRSRRRGYRCRASGRLP